MERSYRRQPRGASSTDAHRESTDDGDHASAPLAPLATAKPPALATAGPGWSAAAAYPAPLPPTLLSVRTTPCLPRLSCPTPPHPGPRPPPPPPAHIFKDKKISPGDPVFHAQPSEPPSGTESGACPRAPVSPGQCLLAPLFRAIDGPPVAPLAGQAASPTPRRTQQLGGALRL